MWFAYDPLDAFFTFDTEAEAHAHAEKMLEYARGLADEGWDESTDEICYGEVKQQAQITSREEAPESSQFDEMIEYELVSVCDEYTIPDVEALVKFIAKKSGSESALLSANPRFTLDAHTLLHHIRDIAGIPEEKMEQWCDEAVDKKDGDE